MFCCACQRASHHWFPRHLARAPTTSPRKSFVHVLSIKNTMATQQCRPSWSPNFSQHICLTGSRSEKTVTSPIKSHQENSMGQEHRTLVALRLGYRLGPWFICDSSDKQRDCCFCASLGHNFGAQL